MNEQAGWPVPEWARRRGIGRTSAYALIREGRGPRLIYPTASRPIVTAEADREWVTRMEREAAQRDPRRVGSLAP